MIDIAGVACGREKDIQQGKGRRNIGKVVMKEAINAKLLGKQQTDGVGESEEG